KPAEWVVPGTGFRVRQPLKLVVDEKDKARLRFTWQGAEYKLRVPKWTSNKLDRRKHATSFAPNVIHSLDAAHLMLTVTNFRRLFPTPPVATVHDSFATCATAATELKEQFTRPFG